MVMTKEEIEALNKKFNSMSRSAADAMAKNMGMPPKKKTTKKSTAKKTTKKGNAK